MLQALIRKVVLCKSDGLIPFIFLLNNCMEKKGNDGRNEGRRGIKCEGNLAGWRRFAKKEKVFAVAKCCIWKVKGLLWLTQISSSA